MEKVVVKFKKLHPQATPPRYHSSEAAGCDLATLENLVIQPGEVQMVSLGFAMDIPQGYWLMIVARSSLYKKGLKLANGVGVVDSDYRGPKDEYRLLLHNFTSQVVTVNKGERLAQAVLMPQLTMSFQEVDTLTAPSRGGFGSSG